jgi:hypothetical protein
MTLSETSEHEGWGNYAQSGRSFSAHQLLIQS